MGRLPRIAFMLLASGILGGCSRAYTRHMSETYKDNKIGNVTFAVMAMPEMDYNPPSSCFSGGSNHADAEKYRKEWEKNLMTTLKANFPKQKFVLVPPARLEELGIKPESFFSRAEADIEKMGVTEYEVQGGAAKPVNYQAATRSPQMQAWGNKLREMDSVDFIIALVNPRMTGETHYNAGHMVPAAGGGMMMTGGGSQTTYTADARFGLWSAETGELAYASGGIANSGGFCVFVSPQMGSIGSYSGDMARQLKALVTAFLQRYQGEAAGLSAAAPMAIESLAQ